MTNLIVLSGLPIRQSKASLAIKLAYDSGGIDVDLDTATVYSHLPTAYYRLKEFVTGKGYLSVNVKTKLLGTVSCSVHSIIGYAMWGDTSLVNGVHIDHINGDKQNNLPNNLQLLTMYDNTQKGWYAYRGNNQVFYSPNKMLIAS